MICTHKFVVNDIRRYLMQTVANVEPRIALTSEAPGCNTCAVGRDGAVLFSLDVTVSPCGRVSRRHIWEKFTRSISLNSIVRNES